MKKIIMLLSFLMVGLNANALKINKTVELDLTKTKEIFIASAEKPVLETNKRIDKVYYHNSVGRRVALQDYQVKHSQDVTEFGTITEIYEIEFPQNVSTVYLTSHDLSTETVLHYSHYKRTLNAGLDNATEILVLKNPGLVEKIIFYIKVIFFNIFSF